MGGGRKSEKSFHTLFFINEGVSMKVVHLPAKKLLCKRKARKLCFYKGLDDSGAVDH